MAIRMSGLASGLDTEAIVKELMSAQSLKKDKVEKAKTKLEWKQDKWKDLNTKLMKLYNEQVSKMQLQSSYKTKKTSISDSSVANVTASSNAVNGSYTMQVNHIATSQYMTGAKLKSTSTFDATSTSSKLVGLDPSLKNKNIEITVGDTKTDFAITADTKVSDLVSALKKAGLNASYDTSQQRFFISSKESGVENAFSIKSSELTTEEIAGQKSIRDAVGYSDMSATNKNIVDTAIETLRSSGSGTADYNKALDNLAKAAYNSKTENAKQAATNYIKAELYSQNYSQYRTDAENSLNRDDYSSDKDYEKAVSEKTDKELETFINKQLSSDDKTKEALDQAIFKGKSETDIQGLSSAAISKYGVKTFDGTEGVTEVGLRADIKTYATSYAEIKNRTTESTTSALKALGMTEVGMDANGVAKVTGTKPDGFAFIEASDSEIVLNGATLTSSTSRVSANGLTIELTGLTKQDESVTFSVSNDVDGVYNAVKNALKEYNEVLKEMNTLYNASSAKGYEPLTSEEKDAMSDSDVELWEKKIKDSLLRGDSTLSSIISGMRNAMMSTVDYNGKTYALSSFGITTSTNYTEGGLLHIYGDSDDATYSSRDDKLKKALEEDPDAVIATLSGVFSKLRETMSQQMAGSKVSSALTFYNDIQMKNDMKSYESDIEDWEDRLADMEDAYYKKFTAMETAMAKLQSQQNSLGGLFGN